jgi:sugar lactone lactonase YvrE
MNRVFMPAIWLLVTVPVLLSCGGGSGDGGTSGGGNPVPAVTYDVSTFVGGGAPERNLCPCRGIDGIGTAAAFRTPYGLAFDRSGNLYVSDTDYAQLRRATPAKVVTTVAGSGEQTFADGAGVAASFFFPRGVAVDAAGVIYVADHVNNMIRKVTPDGVVSVFAGSGEAGYVDGVGRAAKFTRPESVVIDRSGNLFVSDGTPAIRRIASDGTVTTFVGGGVVGYQDGTGLAARLPSGMQLAIDREDNLYFGHPISTNGSRIRKVSPEGVVTTMNTTGVGLDSHGVSIRTLNSAGVMALDAQLNIYVVDYSNLIRKISPEGVISEVAGSWDVGSTDGPGSSATFFNPQGLAIDAQGLIYVAEGSGKVRLIRPK